MKYKNAIIDGIKHDLVELLPNDNRDFIRMNFTEGLLEELSRDEYSVFCSLVMMVGDVDNMVIVCNKTQIEYEELRKIMGIGINKLNTVLRELNKKNMIRATRRNLGRFTITINPNYANRGAISASVLDSFK